jgi:hypothetical protein
LEDNKGRGERKKIRTNEKRRRKKGGTAYSIGSLCLLEGAALS